MAFGEWLRRQLYDRRISNAELARRVGVSPTHIGNLVRNYAPNTKKGTANPTIEMADRIAVAIGVSKDEARMAAGYLPEQPLTAHKPQTLEELLAAFERLGIIPKIFDTEKLRTAPPEEIEKVYDNVALAIELTLKKYKIDGPGTPATSGIGQ